MNHKKFSAILTQARTALELSPHEMAFILGIHYHMYRRYELGMFDKKQTMRKVRMLAKLDSIDIEIEKKILLLRTTLRKFQHDKVSKKVRKIKAIKQRYSASKP